LETKQNHKKIRTSLAIALSKTSEKQALVLSPNNSSLSQHALNRFLGTLVLSLLGFVPLQLSPKVPDTLTQERGGVVCLAISTRHVSHQHIWVKRVTQL